MLARQRQARILAEVRKHGGVRVAELTRLFSVSDMTVRRDLETLASRGLLEKVHGGAAPLPGYSTDEPGFEAKSYRQQREKEEIARAAAQLVQPGTAVAVTAGTTTWALARHLGDVPDLTVVTNSVPVAEILRTSSRTDLTVVLTGGVRTPSDALVGPVADAAISSLHVDLLFMGVHGMADRSGYTSPNLMEAETNRAFVESAGRLVVVADHTKWGIVGLSTIVPLRDADVLISDVQLCTEGREVLSEQVGELVLAECAAVDDALPRPRG